MKCSYCNFENPEKSKFCGKCGKTLSKGGISKTTIFAVFIIVGVLALTMMYLPSSDKKGDEEILPTPMIKDSTGTTAPESNVTSSGSTDTPADLNLSPSPSVLTKIIVSPSTFSIVPGNTKDFYYIANDQFGKRFSTTVRWTSSDTTVGIIDNKGIFTSIAPGTTMITASSGAVSGTAIVTVKTTVTVTATITAIAPEPADIKVSPATVSIAAGSNQQFTASILDQSGNPVSSTVIWSNSNPAVGTIDSSGKFTAIAQGSTTITASSGKVSGSATVTVTPPVPAVINVLPATVSIAAGSGQQFTASILDQSGNPVSSTVIWSNSNPAVGTIDSSGKFTAIAQGSTTITASSGKVSGSATVTVTPRVPSQIIISPATVSVSAGNSQQFAVSILDKSGNPVSSTVIWSSSNAAVGTIDSSGKFTSLAAGTTVVTASSGTVSGTATVTVTTSAPLIAYIYTSDSASANNFKFLLESNGYALDLISIGSISATDFSKYNLIIIGSDNGALSASDVSLITSQSKPLIGLGEGGYSFLGKLSLSTGSPHGWHGSENRIFIVNSNHAIFTKPNSIAIPADNIIQLYSFTGHVGIYLPSPPSNVYLLGRESTDTTHYPLTLENSKYLLWGFTGSPSSMTQTGKDLFINTVNYLIAPPRSIFPDIPIGSRTTVVRKIAYDIPVQVK